MTLIAVYQSLPSALKFELRRGFYTPLDQIGLNVAEIRAQHQVFKRVGMGHNRAFQLAVLRSFHHARTGQWLVAGDCAKELRGKVL